MASVGLDRKRPGKVSFSLEALGEDRVRPMNTKPDQDGVISILHRQKSYPTQKCGSSYFLETRITIKQQENGGRGARGGAITEVLVECEQQQT